MTNLFQKLKCRIISKKTLILNQTQFLGNLYFCKITLHFLIPFSALKQVN
ncbi:hypothetical protein LEP1GSC059_1009 [Leptospira noguchii serovar Panama str. CZ214]|uniref:Uncharacterized protein n=1 Tax=Leptospira noguchii serovar Panama str. CZ214 TaxID=1001595 RepID=T0FNA5_9LEPT|nr:hypothetical protein LEP1GSC059_1009 [Leptospira noguchii serovar Panama str. CZ214]